MPQIYSIKRTLKLPTNVNVLWNFFSRPENLKKILPANLKFKITSPLDSPTIYEGQIIEYNVRSMIGIHYKWITEITEVENNQYFVDEQKEGIFSFWRHQHYFIEIPGGVEMTDIIQYRCRFDIPGEPFNRIFLKRRINYLFNNRQKKLEEIFGTPVH